MIINELLEDDRFLSIYREICDAFHNGNIEKLYDISHKIDTLNIVISRSIICKNLEEEHHKKRDNKK